METTIEGLGFWRLGPFKGDIELYRGYIRPMEKDNGNCYCGL